MPVGTLHGGAKVEWHRGELFPRVGFIVTNMTAAKLEGRYLSAQLVLREGTVLAGQSWEVAKLGRYLSAQLVLREGQFLQASQVAKLRTVSLLKTQLVLD